MFLANPPFTFRPEAATTHFIWKLGPGPGENPWGSPAETRLYEMGGPEELFGALSPSSQLKSLRDWCACPGSWGNGPVKNNKNALDRLRRGEGLPGVLISGFAVAFCRAMSTEVLWLGSCHGPDFQV